MLCRTRSREINHHPWRPATPRPRARTLPLSLLALLWPLATISPAAESNIPPAAVDTMMAAFNRAFFVQTSGTSGYFRASTTEKRSADFWKLAEEIEMVIDAYERSRHPAYSNQVVQLLNGFNEQHGADWSANIYNDDVMWICIANLRAFLMTGDGAYRDRAKTNFDAVYARAWDTNYFGGGLWWTTARTSKNACVNAPAAIAACLLWKTCGDATYRARASAIIDWTKSVLSDGKGQIYDNIRTNGRLRRFSFSYNQGTYIGACNYLGRTNDAGAAADWVMQNHGTMQDGYRILPEYGINRDVPGFHGIFLRWMAKFMKDNHLEATYLPWLRANAYAAWKVRRETDNLSWCQWLHPTPNDPGFEIQSWACSPSLVALQVVP